MKLSAIFLVSGVAVRCRAANLTNPICIVGAGPAGLTIANRLESQGKQTIIFESQPEVSGKCQAYYYENHFHPLGALLYTNDTYRETLQIINEVGVPAVPYTGGMPKWQYDYLSGNVTPASSFSDQERVLLAQEIDRYSVFWAVDFAPRYSFIGYPNGVPQNFTVPTAEWLAKNDYKVLPTLFILGMVSYGYGDLREIPILYMLQYFTPDIVRFFSQTTPGYLIDFHEVFVRYANRSVRGPIHLSSPVTNIDRSGSTPRITYRPGADGAPQVQNCSTLVLAFPPTLAALGAAGLDLVPEEAAVFGAIALTAYFSGAVAMPNVPSLTPFTAARPAHDLPPPADGQPVTFIRLFPDSPLATSWSWANGAAANISVDAARTLLAQTLGRLDRDPEAPPGAPLPQGDADVRAFRGWDYFPHFESPQLAGGWYGRLAALQGARGTWFASGLNGFETVEFAVRAGADVAAGILQA